MEWNPLFISFQNLPNGTPTTWKMLRSVNMYPNVHLLGHVTFCSQAFSGFTNTFLWLLWPASLLQCLPILWFLWNHPECSSCSFHLSNLGSLKLIEVLIILSSSELWHWLALCCPTPRTSPPHTHTPPRVLPKTPTPSCPPSFPSQFKCHLSESYPEHHV